MIAQTRTGRFIAFRQADGIHVVDALGPAPRRVIERDARALAWVGGELWFADASDVLWRVRGEREPERVASVGALRIVAIAGGALVDTAEGTMLVDAEAAPAVVPSGLGDARVLAAAGRRVIAATGDAAELRTLGRRDAVHLPVRGGLARAAGWVLGDRAIAVWLHGLADEIVVCTLDGKLVHRVEVPALRRCVFADDCAIAIGAEDEEVHAIDVRYGRVRASAAIPGIAEISVDAAARWLVLAGDGSVAIARFDDVFAKRSEDLAAGSGELAQADDADEVEDVDDANDTNNAALEPPPHGSEDSTSRMGGLDPLPLALVPAEPEPIAVAPNGAPPYRDAAAHLAALLDVVAARAALAIAESWHSGRTSHDVDGGLPCEREVLGLIGEDVGLAADALRRARTRLAVRARELATRTIATLAAGTRLPFVDVAREAGLSPIATQILACAVAPRLRGRIARLYGVLAGLVGRTECTEHLLELLVEPAPFTALDNALAVELAADAPLVRAGLVQREPHADRVALAVDDVVLDRVRGVWRAVAIGPATTRRCADRELADVIAPRSVVETLLGALAEYDPARPARIVVRGRRGSGRHTLLAALAARVDRTIAQVDVARLPSGAQLPGALARELLRASHARALPVVSELEAIDRSDGELRTRIADTLRRHPGPLAIRAAPESDVPLDPERVDVELPALSAGERITAWRRAFAARELPALDDEALELLAARYRFGTGTIERVAGELARRPSSHVDAVARRYIANRLERVATRITRLAEWDQVTLVDDMRDSVRELIGRMQCQRTVYDDWGFDRRISTARGLTALFYGPPGTGKTLVAGLIGRELGLDVWRVDLARITSKWIGETEKSLAEVFEAAEEGQVMLLFDEADSLFARRSEVRTSNDRYANLEVNYLLQRLDSFEGVAILTTNLEGSIDPAFKRRLSMRLHFPFPDEDQRALLWAAHVPPSVPRTGHLDFGDLARRFPLSGGYIRNSALRAAFLAAQERRPLSQDHLVRAVQLEYRELGKLSSSGRME